MSSYEIQMSSIVEALAKHALGNQLKSFSYQVSYASPGHFPAVAKGTFISENGKKISFEILFVLKELGSWDRNDFGFNIPYNLTVVMAQLDGLWTRLYSNGQWT